MNRIGRIAAIAAIAATIAYMAFIPVQGQPTNHYQVTGPRQPTEDERQAIELMRESAKERERGQLDAATRMATEALAVARKSGMRDTIAMALLHVGTVAKYRGDLSAALNWTNQALLTCELAGNLVCQANARFMLHEVQAQLGQPLQAQREVQLSQKLAEMTGEAQAMANAQSAQLLYGSKDEQRQRAEVLVQQAKRAGSSVDSAMGLRKLGRDAMESGDFGNAAKLLEQARLLAQSSQNPHAEADSLVALAELATAQRRFPQTLDLLAQARVSAIRSGQQGALGNVLLRTATAELLVGQFVQARTSAESALTAYRADGQVLGQGAAQEQIGNADWALGRRKEAESRFREAIKMAVLAGDRNNEANARLRLASLLRAVDRAEAGAEAQKALDLQRALNSRLGIAEVLLEQARIRGAGNDFSGALALAREARDILRQLNRPAQMATADYTIAVAHRFRDELPEASDAAHRAAAAFQRLGMKKQEAEVLTEIAEIQKRSADPAATAANAAAAAARSAAEGRGK
jgi:tetratricopeptide (TPR) repeat protein